MFETIGFSIDYFVGLKFIGYVLIDAPDREHNGYKGRKIEVLQEDVVCTNKKRIKAGEVVKSEQVQLYGRLTKDFRKKAFGI